MFDSYVVDRIAEDCYDLYVSDDDGYTWEYFASYERECDAIEDGMMAVENADSRSGYYTL